MLMWLSVRSAWQAWGVVAVEGVASGSSRGRHGEMCAQRAFRMAGAGKGVTWRVEGRRIAWQAQGIVHGS